MALDLPYNAFSLRMGRASGEDVMDSRVGENVATDQQSQPTQAIVLLSASGGSVTHVLCVYLRSKPLAQSSNSRDKYDQCIESTNDNK